MICVIQCKHQYSRLTYNKETIKKYFTEFNVDIGGGYKDKLTVKTCRPQPLDTMYRSHGRQSSQHSTAAAAVTLGHRSNS